MVSTDPIADMLTRIRNAAYVGKHQIQLPHSNIKETVARELVKSGFLKNVTVEKGTPRNTLIIQICAEGENPKFTELVRMSTPGRRMYASVKDIPKVKSGRGLVILSTSKGVMNGFEAKKQRLGGELLLKVW